MSPFDRAHMTSCWCSIVTTALSHIILEIVNVNNIATLKSRSRFNQGHWKWYHSIDWVWFLLVFYSNLVPKTHRFWDIRLVSIQWPWNPSYGSLTVIGTDTDRSATYDFLLTFHSNHKPISYRFWDKWQLQLKIANLSTLCILRPQWRGSPWNWLLALGVKKLKWWV